MTQILVDKSLLEQAIDTLGYYASVCGEDDQDTPAKQTQSVLRAALAEPALMQKPVAWRFRKNGHWAFRNDNVNGLVCEPLFAIQVPESVYKSALDEWPDKTERVQKTAQTHELGMHRADVLRRRIEAKAKTTLTATEELT